MIMTQLEVVLIGNLITLVLGYLSWIYIWFLFKFYNFLSKIKYIL